MERFRPTGVFLPFGGPQSEHKNDDRETAQRVLGHLGDQPMLWMDVPAQTGEHCVTSAIKVRWQLAAHLDHPDIGQGLASRLRQLGRLFGDFVDKAGPDDESGRMPRDPHGTDPLSVALGWLRALVGIHVGEMAAEYALDVSDDLATTVPDLDWWYFERES